MRRAPVAVRRDPESGIALILALFLVLVGSVMAASLTMLASSTMIPSQSRLGANENLTLP